MERGKNLEIQFRQPWPGIHVLNGQDQKGSSIPYESYYVRRMDGGNISHPHWTDSSCQRRKKVEPVIWRYSIRTESSVLPSARPVVSCQWPRSTTSPRISRRRREPDKECTSSRKREFCGCSIHNAYNRPYARSTIP